MKKQSNLKIHPIANYLPMCSTSEYESLKEDIRIHGQHETIKLYKNEILDGRNRYKACLELGIEPKIENFNGPESELLDYVLSLNIHRRHLSISQKACLSVEILPEIEKKTKENLSKKMSAIRKGDNEVSAKLQNLNSSQTASKIFGISERYIFDAKKLYKESESLFNDVRNGLLTLQQAKKKLNQSEDSAKLQKLEKIDNINLSENIDYKPDNEQLINIEDSAKLQKLEEAKNIELSKLDIKKIKELVLELNITEDKARDYIIKRKRVSIPIKHKQPSGHELKEVKFRLETEYKTLLQEQAKQQNISLSELLRELIKVKIN